MFVLSYASIFSNTHTNMLSVLQPPVLQVPKSAVFLQSMAPSYFPTSYYWPFSPRRLGLRLAHTELLVTGHMVAFTRCFSNDTQICVASITATREGYPGDMYNNSIINYLASFHYWRFICVSWLRSRDVWCLFPRAMSLSASDGILQTPFSYSEIHLRFVAKE
jgi:hypothetical protein